MCALGAWQDCIMRNSGHNEEIAVLLSLSFLMCKVQITTLASWDLCEVWIKYQVALLALVKSVGCISLFFHSSQKIGVRRRSHAGDKAAEIQVYKRCLEERVRERLQ